MKYAVIGNGVAGFTAVQMLSKGISTGSSIVQFTDEKYPYYWRPKLPELLGNDQMVEKDVFAKDLEWYRSNNVELHVEEKVESINPGKKTVLTDKSTYTYDRLLIATGADCFIPPVDGMDLENCFDIRTLQDTIIVRDKLRKSKSVVIVGGGVLGLEIANSCVKRGLKTTVVEYFPYLLPRQLDEEGGKMLKGVLETRNMQFHLGAVVTSVLGDKQVEGVRLEDGKEITADIVFICTGIVPRKELAEKAGLEVNRGIVVNDNLETSIKGIYAAGDVAEYQGRVYGLVMPSAEQARIAAANMLKPGSKKYNGSKPSATLKVTNLFLTSVGDIGKEEAAPNIEVKKIVDEEKGEYIKIFIKGDKLQGGIILGTKRGISLIRKLVEKEIPISEQKDELNEIFPSLL
ncbi:MAG: NAD(P)/FAD-dependent oxidoreductase [Candidatus Hodarchaeales archaeon]